MQISTLNVCGTTFMAHGDTLYGED